MKSRISRVILRSMAIIGLVILLVGALDMLGFGVVLPHGVGLACCIVGALLFVGGQVISAMRKRN